MASATPQTKVTSIEVDPTNRDIALQSIRHAGLEDRVELLLGAGTDILRRIRKEVEAGRRETFDFVFVDADKQNNLNYITDAIPMCRSGAMLIVDNVVREGKLVDEDMAKADGRVAGSRQVVEAAGKDPRLECSLVQTVGEKGYDGMLLCVVK